MVEFRTSAVPRTFDPMSNQHPAQWVVDHLKPTTYEPMNDWLAEVLGEIPLAPSDIIMPDQKLGCFGKGGSYNIDSLLSHVCISKK